MTRCEAPPPARAPSPRPCPRPPARRATLPQRRRAMADQVTRVTTHSWGSRLGKAVGGTLAGIGLVLGAIGALA